MKQAVASRRWDCRCRYTSLLLSSLLLLVCFSITGRVNGFTVPHRWGRHGTALDATRTAISLVDLLSTCMDACFLGCAEIQAVQRHRNECPDGSTLAVEYKNILDPKSAVTQADGAAQAAIVQALRAIWGSGLLIVGEEDDDGDKEAIPTMKSNTPVERQWCLDLDDRIVSLEDIVIYVDPLDGTREFVEGRLSNCQCLIGIAVKGNAVAGVVGIPFSGRDTEATIVYGLVGAGYGSVGAPLVPSNPTHDVRAPRPWVATGDSTASVIRVARDIACRASGTGTTVLGTAIVYGGAGNKLLATALGQVDGTIQHAYGGPWDTCAPTAIVRAMGGRVTNLRGCDVFAGDDSDDYSITNAPGMGFVATGATSMLDHDALIQALLANATVCDYIEQSVAAAAR